MKPKRIAFAPITPALNNVCLLQTTVGAGALLLNGSTAGTLCSAKPWMAYRLDLTSTGNISGVNFTITGTGTNGEAVTETIAGPNNNTVTTTSYFSKVTSITVDGAVGTNTRIGSTGQFRSADIPLDLYIPGWTVDVHVTGTINYSVQKMFERVTQPSITGNPFAIDNLTTQAADANQTLSESPSALRVVANSYSASATLALQINPRRAAV